MKRFLFLIIFSSLLLLPSISYSSVAVEVGIFYDSLSPYGDWIYLNSYGVWVWRPVGLWADWQPYTYGRWEWSEEYGWIWVSYFEWGWAPFHYGRWFYDSYYGWVWVPGTIWRPHWVVWIHSGPYIGWYPYYPSFIYIDYYSPVVYERWIIIEAGQITSGRYRHNAIPKDKMNQVFGSTSGVHKYIPKEDDNAYHKYGPPKGEVEKYASSKIEPIKTDFLNKPVNLFKPDERRYEVYKPDFKTNIGDIGRITDSAINKQVISPHSGKKEISSFKNDSSFAPRYNYPLGSRGFEQVEKGYNYNLKGQPPAFNKTGDGHFQGPRGGYEYKSKETNKFDGNVFKEDSIKSYSPPNQKNIYLPNSSSSDDSDDDNLFKKGIPKFNPKSTTVPKSMPQLKGK